MRRSIAPLLCVAAASALAGGGFGAPKPSKRKVATIAETKTFAALRAWVEANPSAANGACAARFSDCFIASRTTDEPDGVCADKYKSCMAAALAAELRRRVAAA